MELAEKWISECKCDKLSEVWYPTRLLDISALQTASPATSPGRTPDLGDRKIRLIETKKDLRPTTISQYKTNRYMTLSHRWGPKGPRLQLDSKEKLDEFRRGIRLRDFPETFRQAIEFSSRIPGVRYLWIDSICIWQRNEKEWLTESGLMYKVYKNSYLNISATASRSSEDGIYQNRDPRMLWQEGIALNIKGVPGVGEKTLLASPPTSPQGPSYQRPNKETITNRLKLMTIKSPPANNKNNNANNNAIRRCKVVDISLWDNMVDNAEVNKRGWVLQERFLAPRILHFCQNQIAWECCECEHAEQLPKDLPLFHVRGDHIEKRRRLKGLTIRNGMELRGLRLRGKADPDPHLGDNIYWFELWGHIVELYSTMQLTNPRDKLVALAGIADFISTRLGSPDHPAQYVAGLWKKHLASQLLWWIDPIFAPSGGKGPAVLQYLATRPRDGTHGQMYRAPSFSWASVEAQNAKGIVYGDVTDRDILVTVGGTDMSLMSVDNPYGPVDGGHIVLEGILWRASIKALGGKINGEGGFNVSLQLPMEKASLKGKPDELARITRLEKERHSNVYLDCPTDDQVLDKDIFCIPIAKGPRVAAEGKKLLSCLLLQPDSRPESHGLPAFRRVGLLKVDPWAEKSDTEIMLVRPRRERVILV